MSAVMTQPGAGDVAAGIVLEELIGKGALGEVWRARWEESERPVAVKLLSPTGLVQVEDDLERRFAVEAIAAGAIDHPNAVRVLSHGRSNAGTPYVVMELLEGRTLSSPVEHDGMLDVELVARLLEEVGGALDAVHERRLVHRDVKPHNVFLCDDGTFKLIDFGSAKQLDASEAEAVPGRRTDPEIVVGTPAYLSPEMITEPSGADHRADLWALGVTAFKCLTGGLPFPGGDLVDICTRIMSGKMRRPTKLRPTLPGELDLWFARVFAPNIGARPASGAAMAESFRRATSRAVTLPRAAPPRRQPRPSIAPSRWWWAVAALPLAASVAGVVAWRLSPELTAQSAVPAFSEVVAPAIPVTEAEPVSEEVVDEAPPLAPLSLRAALERRRVTVPAGPFTAGCAPADELCEEDEPAAYQAEVEAFRIDRHEVTVGAYAQCVSAGACSDDGLRGFQLGDGAFTVSPRCNWGYHQRQIHPLNCVTFEQAEGYCGWVGARLPTALEWEKAARGDDARIYPWGDQEGSCLLAVMGAGRSGCRAEGTWPVGSKLAGASPFGLYDMAGNVREWVDGWYDVDLGLREARGGSWANAVGRFLRVSEREPLAPTTRSVHAGFRCSSEAPAGT